MRDFVLYTPFYHSLNEERNAENLYCLRKNLEHPDIAKIYLLNEESELPFEHEKLVQISIPKRPSFAYIFDIISKQDTGSSIKILANTDIYFDETLAKAKDIREGEIYALTRWDEQADGTKKFFLKYHSQDAWIFTSNIDSSIGDFPMGQPGCDNRLVYQFKENGFKVKNPSFSIHITHVHASGFRPYLNEKVIEKVDGNYDYILPSYLSEKQKDKKSFYYIRYEFYLHKFQGKLERFVSSWMQRKLALIPCLYYLLLFKLCRSDE